MPSYNEGYKPQASGRISWTKEMRTTLYLLNAQFDLHSHEREVIFKSLFADHLQERDLLHKDLRGSLATQWVTRNVQRSTKSRREWQSICSTSEDEDLKSELVSRIQRTRAGELRDDAFPGPSTPVPGVMARSKGKMKVSFYETPVVACEDDESSDSDYMEPGPSRRRRKKGIQQATSSSGSRPRGIDKNIRLSHSKRPKSVAKVKRSLLPKTPYPRPDDERRNARTLQLTEEEHQRTKEDLVPVDESRSHPPLPPLFYRFWSELEEDANYNSRIGFTSRRHGDSVRMPSSPPQGVYVDWVDIYNHIDRNEVPSPFISVSNAFWWSLRQALKIVLGTTRRGITYSDDYKRRLRISVIDSTALDAKGVYHVFPYQTEIKKKFQYHNGAQFYCGAHEFLVWREIPHRAIIRTLDISDILRITESITMSNPGLRYDLLCQAGNFKTKCIQQLKQQDVELDEGVTAAIAKLATLFGAGLDATMDQTSHFIADIVQGFAIRPQHLASQDWARLASVFEMTMVTSTDRLVLLRDQSMKKAYLDGVRLGNSSNWNTLMDVKKLQAMQRKARKIGLEDTAKILCDDLDAAKLHLRLRERNHQRLLRGEQAPNAAREQTHDTGQDDIDNMEECSERRNAEDDFDGTFEMDEDGRIV